jgi:hypothetical protein
MSLAPGTRIGPYGVAGPLGAGGMGLIGYRQQYDVAPDGRLLINTERPGDAAPITLIQYWAPPAKP